MELKFTVHTKIQKPVAEVFDAVKKVVPNNLIVFEWETSEGGYDTRTEMLCALKAWLEYGINLRKGAY